MTPLFRRFLSDDSGATAIEYGMIVALIFLVIVGSVGLFADRATAMFNYVSSTVASVI